jgi:hypothetical protein
MHAKSTKTVCKIVFLQGLEVTTLSAVDLTESLITVTPVSRGVEVQVSRGCAYSGPLNIEMKRKGESEKEQNFA